MKRDVLSSPRLKELKRKRRRVIWGKILLFLLGFSAIFISSVYLSRLDRLNISEIQINGNKIVDTEALKSVTQDSIAGKYFWLFPKTNIFYYPQNAIKNNIQAKYAGLKEINLSIKDNKILEVVVSERTPSYLWGGSVTPELNSNSNQKCYFMDSTGYIFDEAPYFSGGVYFKFYGDNNLNIENPSGAYFLKDKFIKIIAFKNIVENLGIKATALVVDNNRDAHLLLSSKSTTSPEIIFKIDSDLGKVAENLQAALSTEPLKSKFKNNYGALQYIDLRFGNKVYSKFQ